MQLEQLNTLSLEQATTAFMQCCVAERWVQKMVHSRPYVSREDLCQRADAYWSEMLEADWLQAFEGHPKIGDVHSLKQKYAATKSLAAGEQASVNAADEAVLQRLATGNQAYEQRFGFIFIVCATGKSAAEMLALLEDRLPHERALELRIAAEEQRKITQIRLQKLVAN